MNFVEAENIKLLARRQALRDAIRAVEGVLQANKGERVLIRKKDAISAVAGLTCNSLVWGGVFVEEKLPEPPEATL
jgi:hypothetical protein